MLMTSCNNPVHPIPFYPQSKTFTQTPSSEQTQLEQANQDKAALRSALEQANRENAVLKAQLEQAKRKNAALELPIEQDTKSQQQRKETLNALRERDRLQVQLEDSRKCYEDLLIYTPALGRPTELLHGHFAKQMRERFGISLDFVALEQLQKMADKRPSVGFTHMGSPIKRLPVDGALVYAIMSRNTWGEVTLTTAYLPDMVKHLDLFGDGE